MGPVTGVGDQGRVGQSSTQADYSIVGQGRTGWSRSERDRGEADKVWAVTWRIPELTREQHVK